jgi:hypothetical protein
MPVNRNHPNQRAARLPAMLEEFRVAKQRQLVRRGMTLWNRGEAQHALAPRGQPWPVDPQSEAALSKLAADFSPTAESRSGPKE